MNMIFERRQKIICDICGREMVFGKHIMKSPKDDTIYLKYICPCREAEKGCGASKMVRFDREVNAKFERTKENTFERI